MLDACSRISFRSNTDASMSQLLINQFLNELHRLRKISGTKRETVVREAFKDLVKAWGKGCDLQFIAEYQIVTPAKNTIYVDGALLHSLRVPFGYWEGFESKSRSARSICCGYPSALTLRSREAASRRARAASQLQCNNIECPLVLPDALKGSSA
jgi:hypothetical protein